jgi:DNA repair exonuclease SbcCD nuclease subunit
MIAQDLKGEGRRSQRYRDFLSRCSADFPNVIYIAGNHEFYHGSWPSHIDILRRECERYSNIKFLDMDAFTIEDITFLGATLWTDMNRGDWKTLYSMKTLMADFNVVRNSRFGYCKLRAEDVAEEFHRTVSWIRSCVAEQHDRKFVVVGHHAPSTLSIHEKYKHDTIMNGGYASDLYDFIADRPQIKLWTHGHTHTPFDYMIDQTRIVCNPRGYEGHEALSGWNPALVIEV